MPSCDYVVPAYDDKASDITVVIVGILIISVIAALVISAAYISNDHHAGAGWRESAAADAAKVYAREYGLADKMAQEYSLEGDGWMSAVAHELAAEAAGGAAEEWTEVLEALMEGDDWSGRDAHMQYAAANASRWVMTQAEAYWLAAEAAAGAGRGAEADVLASKAADALKLKADIQFSLATDDERRSISMAIDAQAKEGPSPREFRSMRP